VGLTDSLAVLLRSQMSKSKGGSLGLSRALAAIVCLLTFECECSAFNAR